MVDRAPLVSRELLDAGDPKTAYRVAATGAIPDASNYRAEQQFTAGWIALAFLKDPRTAQAHFSRIAHGQSNPITLSPRLLLAGPRGGGGRRHWLGTVAL